MIDLSKFDLISQYQLQNNPVYYNIYAQCKTCKECYYVTTIKTRYSPYDNINTSNIIMTTHWKHLFKDFYHTNKKIHMYVNGHIIDKCLVCH